MIDGHCQIFLHRLCCVKSLSKFYLYHDASHRPKLYFMRLKQGFKILDALAPVTPSQRANIKWLLGTVGQWARKAQFWQWTAAEVRPLNCTHRVSYFGTRSGRGIVELPLSGNAAELLSDCDSVMVSELPLPGALRIPRYMQLNIPLHQSLDALLEGYGDKLRRVVRQQLIKAKVVRAEDQQQITFADDNMLKPYASSRYGPSAHQLSTALIAEITGGAKGGLDILYSNDEPVACHLGVTQIRKDQRYWIAVRFGYREVVFNAPKRLHEINSVNVFLATKYAKENGFDFYGLGNCLAHPDDGLLHWKRRRGGLLDATQCHEWFYVRLPKIQACAFLWSTPLFSAQRGGKNLELHIGIPKGSDDTAVLHRYREMSFSGRCNVVVHHEDTLSTALVSALGALLTGAWPTPQMKLQHHER